MLEIVSAATEYDTIPIRPGEEDTVKKLLNHSPVAVRVMSAYQQGSCSCSPSAFMHSGMVHCMSE